MLQLDTASVARQGRNRSSTLTKAEKKGRKEFSFRTGLGLQEIRKGEERKHRQQGEVQDRRYLKATHRPHLMR